MIACRYSENPVIEHIAYGGADMEARDDISLLRAIAQQRDREAFAELHERYQKRAYNQAFRILHNRTMAEDAVQESMVLIWIAAKAVLPTGDAENWILRIVTNKSIDIGLSQRQRAKREERMAMEKSRLESAVAEVIEGHELIGVLRSQIDQLPELERTLLACSYGAKMSQQDIAKLLMVSQKTVSNKIQDALDRLRTGLTKVGVAAVVPMLSRGNLFEAVTTGHECPPGMIERTMERIAGHEKAVLTLSRRTTSVHGWLPLAAGVTVFAAAACGFWWAKSVRKETRATSVPATVQALPPNHIPFSYTWNFNTSEAPKDIQTIEGSWHFEPGGGPDGSGCMETDGESAMLSLHIPAIENRWIKVSLKCWKPTTENRGMSYCAMAWKDALGRGSVQVAGLDGVSIVNPRDWFTRTFYISATTLDTWVNGKHSGITFFNYRSTGLSPLMLMFGGSHMRIDDLTICEIRADEVPDIHQYREAVEKIEPSRRVGTVILSELKPVSPGGPVTATFYAASDSDLKE